MKFKIIHTDNLGSTPAKAIRKLNIIYINDPVFNKLPKDTQDYVIEHEKAHIINDSNDEIEADNLAFLNYAGSRPQSLRKSIIALTNGLSFDRDEHVLRLYKQIERALTYDFKVNKNKKAFLTLQKMKNSGSQFLEPQNIDMLLLESGYLKKSDIKGISCSFEGKDSYQLTTGKEPINVNIPKRNISLIKADVEPIKLNNPKNFYKPAISFSNFHRYSKPMMIDPILKPMRYDPDQLAREIAEEKLLNSAYRSGGGGSGSYNDLFDEKSTEENTNESQKPDKFLGMPRKTGIGVAIAAAVIVVGIIAYFLLRKKH